MSPIIIYEIYGIYRNYGFIGIMKFTTTVERTNKDEWSQAMPHHI